MNRPLSILLVLPLIGLLLLAVARVGRGRAVRPWIVAAGVGAAQLVVALAVHAGFDVATSRYDGNEGFQFVERSALLSGVGIEYALGVDGLSVGLVAFSAFALLAVALLGSRTSANLGRHWVLVLLADLGVIGALVAIDLALILAFWGLALLASTLIIGASAENGARRIAARFGVLSLVAYTLVVASSVFVASNAGAFSIPELTRADLLGDRLLFAKIPAIKVVYPALFLGLGALMGVAPFNAWLTGTIARVPAATALLVSVAASGVAAYLLLRIGYGVLAQGTAWAAPALGGLGALSVVWGAFTSTAHGDLKRLAASVGVVNLGVCVFALGSLTAIGVEGCVAAIQNHVLYSVLVFALAARLEARVGSCDLGRARAVLIAAPLGAVIAAAMCLSQFGAPGSYAFVAHVLSIVGALPLRPLAALAVVAGLAVLTFSQARLVKRILDARVSGPEAAEAPPSRSAFVSPEGSILAASALAVIVLGCWPKPALSAVSSSALDHAARVNPPGPLEIVEERRNGSGYGLARALLGLRQRAPTRTALSRSRNRPLFAACVQAKP